MGFQLESKSGDEMRFEGQNVLVTGGARGIGMAIASAFLEEGARVLVADRDRDGLATLGERIGSGEPLETIEVELAEPGAATRLGAAAEEAIGPLDVLVNNAGLMSQIPVLEISESEWDRLFAVNLRATFFLTQAVAARMADRRRGSVVSIASVNALRTESPEAHYNATKAGIVAIMRSFANELGHLGLRFNCVAPGETVSASEAATYTDEDVARTREYLLRVPMRRVARPAEQAQAVLFLASDAASYDNGHTLVADGGELTGDWYDTARRPPVPARLEGLEDGDR
jgi:NAD(P)-dependent dehydrogenase (short-subunit alcohol dehydrogenase family)